MKNLYFDNSLNKLIELFEFNNGVSDYYFSETLHKIILYCDRYGLNYLDYSTFNEVKNILNI